MLNFWHLDFGDVAVFFLLCCVEYHRDSLEFNKEGSG